MAWRVPQAALALALLAMPASLPGQAEALQARASVEGQQVYVGQQFLLRIRVEGTEQPDPVDIGALERDFTVSEAGGGASSSTSVSIVNGRMTQQVQRAYTLNYRLAARKAGDVAIPALAITADGRTARTRPITLRVLPPRENDDFKLQLELSATRAYVGQPVALDAIWYIGREVRDFSFTMPLLEDRRFEVLDPEASASAGQAATADERLEIQLGDRRAAARKGRGSLGGREYTTLRFRKLLVPREAGSMVLPTATVTFLTPSQTRSRARDPFDDSFFGGGLFADFFGRRPVVETLAIPSNRLRLEVLDLPTAGRPPGFNGWIGVFRLQTEASPDRVAVGEPITLKVQVEGEPRRAAARLPALDEQADLVRDFKVPREMAAGEDRGDAKFFTQTLRAKHDRVTQIPAIELPYFDPEAGAYRIARSEPIPLSVEAARIVTADDAEGLGSGPRQMEVKSTEQGIAHNYVDASALRPAARSWQAWLLPLGPVPVALAVVAVPPLVYFCLLAASSIRKRGAAPWRLRPSAYAQWRKSIAAIEADRAAEREASAAVLSALRAYLEARLGLGRGAWGFDDAAVRLRDGATRRKGKPRAGGEETLTALRDVFERCEAGSYAGSGAMDAAWKARLLADAKAAVALIEERLG